MPGLRVCDEAVRAYGCPEVMSRTGRDMGTYTCCPRLLPTGGPPRNDTEAGVSPLMKNARHFVVMAVTALGAGLLVPLLSVTPANAGTNGCPPGGVFYGVAHQGAHDNVGTTTWRNTLPGFKKAQDRCLWVESDVRFTRDMIPVMVHDQSTGPMFRQRCNLVVADHTLAELQTACRNPDGSTVATFDQFLDLIDTTQAEVEIKPGSTSDPKLKMLISDIYAHNDEGRVALEFTTEKVLARIAALDNDANPIMRAWKGALVGFPDRVAAACDFAIYNYVNVNSIVVQKLKDRGVLTIASISTDHTPNRQTAWNSLVAAGAAAVQTDYAAELFTWQNSR